jgi:Tfp pilus assembly protein PilF
MSRLEQLRAMLHDDPDDLFLNFGLAMELLKEGQVQEALASFDRAIQIDPGHAPAHQQKARALLQIGRNEEAVEALRAGIGAAQRSGDRHAVDDMQKTLQAIQAGLQGP